MLQPTLLRPIRIDRVTPHSARCLARALVQVQVLEAAKVTDPETVLELEQALDRALERALG